jgi:hypothetical protein
MRFDFMNLFGLRSQANELVVSSGAVESGANALTESDQNARNAINGRIQDSNDTTETAFSSDVESKQNESSNPNSLTNTSRSSFLAALPVPSPRSSAPTDEWENEPGSLEATVDEEGEDSLPVLTQYRIVLFSQHEGSVKVMREHQCLLQTVLLTVQQVRKRQQVLEHELRLLLKLRPDRANMLHERVGRSLVLRPAHELRKSHELLLVKQRRQLRCLQLKMLQLTKVMLEERARAKTRVDRLQRDYQRQQTV